MGVIRLSQSAGAGSNRAFANPEQVITGPNHTCLSDRRTNDKTILFCQAHYQNDARRVASAMTNRPERRRRKWDHINSRGAKLA